MDNVFQPGCMLFVRTRTGSDTGGDMYVGKMIGDTSRGLLIDMGKDASFRPQGVTLIPWTAIETMSLNVT